MPWMRSGKYHKICPLCWETRCSPYKSIWRVGRELLLGVAMTRLCRLRIGPTTALVTTRSWSFGREQVRSLHRRGRMKEGRRERWSSQNVCRWFRTPGAMGAARLSGSGCVPLESRTTRGCRSPPGAARRGPSFADDVGKEGWGFRGRAGPKAEERGCRRRAFHPSFPQRCRGGGEGRGVARSSSPYPVDMALTVGGRWVRKGSGLQPKGRGLGDAGGDDRRDSLVPHGDRSVGRGRRTRSVVGPRAADGGVGGGGGGVVGGGGSSGFLATGGAKAEAGGDDASALLLRYGTTASRRVSNPSVAGIGCVGGSMENCMFTSSGMLSDSCSQDGLNGFGAFVAKQGSSFYGDGRVGRLLCGGGGPKFIEGGPREGCVKTFIVCSNFRGVQVMVGSGCWFLWWAPCPSISGGFSRAWALWGRSPVGPPEALEGGSDWGRTERWRLGCWFLSCSWDGGPDRCSGIRRASRGGVWW